MAQANVMFWNLGDLTQKRAVDTGHAYIQFLASVMELGGISLIGFSGIRSSLGRSLSDGLATELNNRAKSTSTWNSFASPPLGAGRDEQYAVVWNMKVLEAMPFDGNNYWRWEYKVPGTETPPQYYGFPRVASASPDMPPAMLYFKLVGTDKRMVVALFHAPDWMLGGTAGRGIQLACQNIAQITDFDQGQAGLLMGTFNVPMDDDVATSDSNGAHAFGPLAGPSGKYQQMLSHQPTLLSDTMQVAIPMEEAVVQTSENIFFRKDGPTNGIQCGNAGVPNLLLYTLGRLNDQGDGRVRGPLSIPLANVELNVRGKDNLTAAPDGTYGKLDEAFSVYRPYISAYLPIVATLTY